MIDQADAKKILDRITENCVRRQFLEGFAPGTIAVHMWVADIEEERIAALHQLADSDHWNGQVFRRVEEAA